MTQDFDKLVSEVVDLGGSEPVSFLAKRFAAELVRERLTRAQHALQRRMKRGRPWAIREAGVAALTYDYLRAAEAGAAHANLEVMADLLANGVGEAGLTEEALRHLMTIVASLSYDEMRALAALIRADAEVAPDQENREPMVYRNALQELSDGLPGEELEVASAALVSLVRTGLVIVGSGFGSLVFYGSPLLRRLASLIDAGSFPDPARTTSA